MTFYLATDLETTGLSAEKDVILEAAFSLLDADLEVIDSFETLVHDQSQLYLDAINRTLYGEDQYVNKMHAESGLWDDWNDESKPSMTPTQLSIKLIDWLYDKGMTPRSVPMLGNSIGSLDRPFFLRHLPDANEFLSYRNFDVSTLRMFVTDNCLPLQQEWEDKLREIEANAEPHEKTHRAAWDVKVCIQQVKHYREGIRFE